MIGNATGDAPVFVIKTSFGTYEYTFFPEGGLLSRTLNLVPGFNSVAYLHDSWNTPIFEAKYSTFWHLTLTTINIPPAIVINYSVLATPYIEQMNHNICQTAMENGCH